MNISNLENVEKGDWIVAFNNNVIVGARQWNGGVVDVPVMGFDNDDATIGYCNLNEIPTFKVYSNYNHQFAEIQSNQITQFIPNSIVYVQNLGFGSKTNIQLLHPLSILDLEVSDSKAGSLQYVKEMRRTMPLKEIFNCMHKKFLR